MAWIYLITNDINGKQYVGKTEYEDIQERFKEHCQDYKRKRCEKRPLYNAMNKYGIEHFHIEPIEYVPPEINLEEREIYWIMQYNTYHNGYNATLGGDGKTLYNHELIKKELLKHPYPKQVANLFGCSTDLVRMIAHQNNITVINLGNNLFKEKIKPINQYSKTNEFIQSFNSIADAARWLYENNKCAQLNSGVRGHISDVCNNKRKTAYGYIWQYAN